MKVTCDDNYFVLNGDTGLYTEKEISLYRRWGVGLHKISDINYKQSPLCKKTSVWVEISFEIGTRINPQKDCVEWQSGK